MHHLTSIDNSIGAFHAATGDYDAGFFFAGAMILVSGLMLFLLPRRQRETKWSNTKSTIHFLEATLTIVSVVAWPHRVPPMVCRPMKNDQNTAQDRNSDTVVTHL